MPLADRFQKYIRVLQIMKKPDREEFWTSAKVTGAGMLLVGLVGYIVYLIMSAIWAMGAV